MKDIDTLSETENEEIYRISAGQTHEVFLEHWLRVCHLPCLTAAELEPIKYSILPPPTGNVIRRSLHRFFARRKYWYDAYDRAVSRALIAIGAFCALSFGGMLLSGIFAMTSGLRWMWALYFLCFVIGSIVAIVGLSQSRLYFESFYDRIPVWDEITCDKKTLYEADMPYKLWLLVSSSGKEQVEIQADSVYKIKFRLAFPRVCSPARILYVTLNEEKLELARRAVCYWYC